MTGCHCLCGRRHGYGLCTGSAQVFVEMEPNPYARVVPMCAACAAAEPRQPKEQRHA